MALNQGGQANVSDLASSHVLLDETVYQSTVETKLQKEAQWKELCKACEHYLAEIQSGLDLMKCEMEELARQSQYRTRRGYDDTTDAGTEADSIDLNVLRPETDALRNRLGDHKAAYAKELALAGRFSNTKLQNIALSLDKLDNAVLISRKKLGSVW